MASYIETTSSPLPASAGTYIRDAQWGIDNTLSGWIIQNETISESRSTDTTQDQKGAVVSELDYDKSWGLTLNIIGNGTIPSVGDTTFSYGGNNWKVDSVNYAGSFNDKKKYTINAHRFANFPAQPTA